MKPDKVTCTNCNKRIDRGKWCSDKCRKSHARKSDKVGDKPGQETRTKSDKPNPDTQSRTPANAPANAPEQLLGFSLTRTDRTFFDRALKDFGEPYYRFSKESKKGTCLKCGKKYSSGLSLNKYCKYECYSTAWTKRAVK